MYGSPGARGVGLNFANLGGDRFEVNGRAQGAPQPDRSDRKYSGVELGNIKSGLTEGPQGPLQELGNNQSEFLVSKRKGTALSGGLEGRMAGGNGADGIGNSGGSMR